MPAGSLITVPDPVPLLLTLNWYWFKVKVAVTDLAALIVTTQVPVPVQPSPLQPVNVEPVAVVAVRVTTVPESKIYSQVAPQSMPGGLLVTVPEPVPLRLTVNAYCSSWYSTAEILIGAPILVCKWS